MSGSDSEEGAPSGVSTHKIWEHMSKITRMSKVKDEYFKSMDATDAPRSWEDVAARLEDVESAMKDAMALKKLEEDNPSKFDVRASVQ